MLTTTDMKSPTDPAGQPHNFANAPVAARPVELDLIEAIRKRAAAGAESARKRGQVRLGIGDDCAILRPRPGEEIVVTTDLSLEGVHFRRKWHPAEAVGHRCLARGLSDLAAMGARPMAAFLSLAIPPELTRATGASTTRPARNRPLIEPSLTPSVVSWMDRFLEGFFRLAETHRVVLAGGDLAQSPAVVNGPSPVHSLVTADIVLLGSVPRGDALLRSTARAGDILYVTGALGGAAAELLALERSPQRYRAALSTQPHPHLYPQPRLAVGTRLRANALASAAIDISDGLSTDLAHLCDASHLAAEIDSQALPVDLMASLAEKAGWTSSALDLALHGGEDYELLFTARPNTRMPTTIAGVPIHRIGRMIRLTSRRPTLTLVSGPHREPLAPGGWQHFVAR